MAEKRNSFWFEILLYIQFIYIPDLWGKRIKEKKHWHLYIYTPTMCVYRGRDIVWSAVLSWHTGPDRQMKRWAANCCRCSIQFICMTATVCGHRVHFKPIYTYFPLLLYHCVTRMMMIFSFIIFFLFFTFKIPVRNVLEFRLLFWKFSHRQIWFYV